MDFLNLIWLVPLLPLFGALVIGIAGRGMPRNAIAALGSGTVGLAFLVSLGAFLQFTSAEGDPARFVRDYFTWIQAGSFGIPRCPTALAESMPVPER